MMTCMTAAQQLSHRLRQKPHRRTSRHVHPPSPCSPPCSPPPTFWGPGRSHARLVLGTPPLPSPPLPPCPRLPPLPHILTFTPYLHPVYGRRQASGRHGASASCPIHYSTRRRLTSGRQSSSTTRFASRGCSAICCGAHQDAAARRTARSV